MTSKRQVSTSALPSARSTIISKSISISPTQLPFDNLHNISPLLKRMRNERTSKMTNSISESSIRLMNTHHQQKTLINTPLSVNQLKNNTFHRRKQQLLKYFFIVLYILQPKLNFHVDRRQKKSTNSIVLHIAQPIVRSSSSVSSHASSNSRYIKNKRYNHWWLEWWSIRIHFQWL